MKAWRIKDWEKTYENKDTRKLVRLNWVPIPNKHDSLTFSRIRREQDAAAIYCGFQLMVQLASKSERSQRGWIVSGGEALTLEDMALVTGFPVDVFEAATGFLNGKWVSEEEMPAEDAAEEDARSPVFPDRPEQSPDTPGESPEASGKPPGRKNGKNGMNEGKLERERASGNFPTSDEIKELGAMRNMPPEMCQRFWDHYEGNNLWLNQHGRLIKWQTKLATWKTTEEERKQKKHGSNKSNYPPRVDRNANNLNAGSAHEYANIG
jgi:hypothetical protein